MFLCSPFRIRRQVGIDRGLASFESNKEASFRSLLNFHSVQDAVVARKPNIAIPVESTPWKMKAVAISSNPFNVEPTKFTRD